jgi:hypothetical protein
MPADTNAILAGIRTRCLAYTPPSGATLASLVTSRFYRGAAPDSAAFPYVVARIIANATDADYGGRRAELAVEIIAYGRPRSAAPTVETIMDRIDQALLGYIGRDDTDRGIVFAQDRMRMTVPELPAPADRELVQVRSVFRLVAWPDYLVTVA